MQEGNLSSSRPENNSTESTAGVSESQNACNVAEENKKPCCCRKTRSLALLSSLLVVLTVSRGLAERYLAGVNFWQEYGFFDCIRRYARQGHHSNARR